MRPNGSLAPRRPPNAELFPFGAPAYLMGGRVPLFGLRGPSGMTPEPAPHRLADTMSAMRHLRVLGSCGACPEAGRAASGSEPRLDLIAAEAGARAARAGARRLTLAHFWPGCDHGVSVAEAAGNFPREVLATDEDLLVPLG